MSEGEVVFFQLRMRSHTLHSQLIVPAGGGYDQLISSGLRLDDELAGPGGGHAQLELAAGLVAPVLLLFNNL
jgi:hypothetical protein